jgi:hypothetical protein
MAARAFWQNNILNTIGFGGSFLKKKTHLATILAGGRSWSCVTSQHFFIFQKLKRCIYMPLKFTIDFFGESSRVDATLLTRIISKGFATFKLKFFQIHSFLYLLKF